MSWRIAITHRSRYRYAEPVLASYNELRMTPRSTGRQRVLDASCSVTPASELTTYVDYWGTLVHSFDLHAPHRLLEVLGRCEVETAPAEPVGGTAGWDQLTDPALREGFAELLAPTAYAPFDPAFARLAEAAGAGRAGAGAGRAGAGGGRAATPLETLERLSSSLRRQVRYVPGSTEVTTTAPQAFLQGAGVCQDFAHIALAVCRMAGIPARYVSGYLYPREDAAPGATVHGASHAWVEAWLGDWVAFDPTNGDPVGERHVVVARGRDYADVAPFRGVYRGGAVSALTVEVALRRTA